MKRKKKKNKIKVQKKRKKKKMLKMKILNKKCNLNLAREKESILKGHKQANQKNLSDKVH